MCACTCNHIYPPIHVQGGYPCSVCPVAAHASQSPRHSYQQDLEVPPHASCWHRALHRHTHSWKQCPWSHSQPLVLTPDTQVLSHQSWPLNPHSALGASLTPLLPGRFTHAWAGPASLLLLITHSLTHPVELQSLAPWRHGSSAPWSDPSCCTHTPCTCAHRIGSPHPGQG